MRKEFKLLYSSLWRSVLFLLLTILCIVMVSTSGSEITSTLKAADFQAYEGPYREDLLQEIEQDPAFVRGTVGFEKDPLDLLRRVYFEKYESMQEKMSISSEDSSDPELLTRAQKIQSDPKFYYTNNWYSQAFYFTQRGAIIPQLFTVALILFAAHFLSIEKEEGTWLVISGTAGGRRGFLRKKWLALFLSGATATLLLFIFSFLPMIRTGEWRHFNRTVSETLYDLPLWNITLLGKVLLILIFWLLGVALLCSGILFISSLTSNGLMNMILGMFFLLFLPLGLQSISPRINPLIFPVNTMSASSIIVNHSLGEGTTLSHFLALRPLLSHNKLVLLLYLLLMPALTSILYLYLAQKRIRKWY